MNRPVSTPPSFPRYATAVALSALLLLSSAGLPFPPIPPARAETGDAAVAAILSCAESLFKAMKARDGRTTWTLLTEKSRATIADETFKALATPGGATPAPSREEVSRDFAAGGPIARSYWEGFLRRFDPDQALERSRWEIGTIDRDHAVVVLTYRDSDRPAVVRMAREGGGWKVGLVETFWTR